MGSRGLVSQGSTASTPRAAEVRAYLEKHNLELHIQSALNTAIRSRVQNPLMKISELLRDAHIEKFGDGDGGGGSGVAVGELQPAGSSAAPRPRESDGFPPPPGQSADDPGGFSPPDSDTPVAESYLYTPSFAKAFARWDKNGDGKIDLEELRTLLLDIGALLCRKL